MKTIKVRMEDETYYLIERVCERLMFKREAFMQMAIVELLQKYALENIEDKVIVVSAELEDPTDRRQQRTLYAGYNEEQPDEI